jgi:YD repeat-containing protein
VVSAIQRVVSSVTRASTYFDYANTSGDQTPRLTDTKVEAENWTGINDVPSLVTTQLSVDTDGAHRLTAPDDSVYKEYYGSTWQQGLTIKTKSYASSADADADTDALPKWQKKTTATWTQDNTNIGYQLNPRVTETNIYDASGNRRHSVMGYSSSFTPSGGTSMVLPSDSYEYDGDTRNILRRSHTDYNLDSAYLNRWIIGLPSTTYVCDGAEGFVPCSNNSANAHSLFAKSTFQYDETGAVSYQGSPVKHDDDNYGSSFVSTSNFIAARANLSSSRRYNVSTLSQSTGGSVQYNTTGSAISATDALNHLSTISYSDSFSDNANHNTFAYPTTATDADGYQSFVQYNYDFGAKTRTQGPPPANQSQGIVQTFSYDGAARVQQVTTTNNGGYTRYVYGPNYVQSYASVNNVADEAYTIQIVDGAGRVIASAKNHPGSTGGYSGVATIYDQMGRVIKQSNPTETSATGSPWTATGVDAPGNGGTNWIYSLQTYDWKGRPLLTTNTDTTQKSASYGGCGCAGGEVVTVQDEVGRKQRSTSDGLGRAFKTEVLKAADTVYSATVTDYDVRDQVKAVKSYKGAATSDFSCPTGTCMQSVTTYDGYGRIATQKLPQQSAVTTYTYNEDDLVQTVTDPRNVVATNTYNNHRHLLTGVSYSAPSGIAAPGAVSFSYDGARNRTAMSDGTGGIDYHYDTLSRMTSEIRTFSLPSFNHSYTISYSYNLTGSLTSITDPSGAQVSYNYDQAGRLTSMPASGYTGVTNFLSNLTYRAFGGMQHATYGNSAQVDLTYNQRMQVGQYKVSGFSANGTAYNLGTNLIYYDDGRTNAANDLNDARFDRKYEFDSGARLKEAYSGAEAHGQAAPPLTQADSPYRQSYTYDEWNNALTRSGRIWTVNDSETVNFTGDNKHQYWGYDAAGNALTTNDGTYTYDAAEHPVTFASSQEWQAYSGWDNSTHPNGPALETWDTFDGTGQTVKHVSHTRIDGSYEGDYGFAYWVDENTMSTYYLHSTVLGGKTIDELNQSGAKTVGYVYAGDARIATQQLYGSSNSTTLECKNPVTGSAITTDANASYSIRQEPDPLGRDVAQPIINTALSVPSIYGVFKDRAMPIEASWGPSQDYLDANAAWGREMEYQTYLYQTDYFKVKGQLINLLINLVMTRDNDLLAQAQQLLEDNPNFRMEVNGASVAGDDAAIALTGALAHLPGDPLSLNRPKFAHGQGTTAQFNYGRYGAGFNDDQLGQLSAVLKTIGGKNCRDWIDTQLWAKRHVGPQTEDAQIYGLNELLSRASINMYSPSLTAQQMGIPEIEREGNALTEKWPYTFNGVANGNKIWLNTHAFHTGKFDLAGIIVHELLHVAGINSDAEGFNDQIQSHCGWGGIIGD